MASTEQQVLEIIYRKGGRASIWEIAREIGFSSDYARIVCESLGRRDYIDYFASRGICVLKEKGAAMGKRAAPQKGQPIPEESSGKRRVIVGY